MSHMCYFSDCGGITFDGSYTLRKGTVLKKSPSDEISWISCKIYGIFIIYDNEKNITS